MSLKDANRYGSQALRSFQWSGYAPFFWMLAVEAVFLFLGFNLGAPWGMATAGAMAARIAGGGATHYPAFFLVLPVVYSYLDVALYTVLGAALIPLAITRVLAAEMKKPGGPPAASRVRGAILPSFIVFVVVVGILYLWELAIPRAVAPVVGLIPRVGFFAPVITWIVGTLVGLVVSTISICVPIVAVREGGGLGAIGRGLADGFRFLPTTYLIVLWYSALPLLLMAFIQLNGSALVTRLMPETVPWLLVAYAILMSLANYLVYSAAARYHAAVVKEEE